MIKLFQKIKFHTGSKLKLKGNKASCGSLLYVYIYCVKVFDLICSFIDYHLKMFCLSERHSSEKAETKNEFGWWINEPEMLISSPFSKKIKSQNSSPTIISTKSEDFNLNHESNFSSKISESKELEMKSLNSLDSQIENEQKNFHNLNTDINQIENQENCIENFNTDYKEDNSSENFRKFPRGISYTPERLVKSEEYKIISPSFQSAFIHSTKSEQRKLSKLIDRKQIGASYLERLLCPNIAEIEDYNSFDSGRFLVKGELNENDKDLSRESSGFEKLKSLYLKEKGRNHKFSFDEDDTSGIQSIWSLDTSSDPSQVPLRLQKLTSRFSSSQEVEGLILERNPRNVIEDPENVYQLQSRVERLRAVNENIHKDIGTLKKDFQTEEWKVEDLLEDVCNFRREMQDLKYLDDLLNLLQGELEIISQKSWPFVSGHADPYNEEINFII